jgi:hypothetical protein
MIKLDVRRRFDPQMALAVAESQKLYAAGPPAAADDLTAQRDAYNRERAFWNAVKPPLPAVEALTIPGSRCLTARSGYIAPLDGCRGATHARESNESVAPGRGLRSARPAVHWGWFDFALGNHKV